MGKRRNNSLWYDRKRTFLGLPWSFTKYELTEDRLFVETGFFKTDYDEVRLYRIIDVGLTRTLGQKMLGLGTVTVHSSDATLKDFAIKNVKKPKYVAEILSNQVEKERISHKVSSREIIDHDDDDNDDDNN